MKTPEGKLKDQVKALLNGLGVYWYMPVTNGMGRAGAPDFICCWNGMFLGVETKAPGKRGNTTPNQDRELADIRKAGGAAIVIDHIDQLREVFVKFAAAAGSGLPVSKD